MRKVEFNFNLHRAIISAGMTQAAIADKADISRPVLSQIVNGRLNPTEEESTKLCEILGKTKQHLFRE